MELEPFRNEKYEHRPQADTKYYVTTKNDPKPQVKMLEYMIERRRLF